MPHLDVIMPVYNSAAALPLTLDALGQQALLAGWTARLIAVDDGSTDTSVQLLRAARWKPPWQPAHILRQEHQGASAARNAALRQSSADVVLLLGADIVVRPDCLTHHLRFHELHPAYCEMALGMVAWDPRVFPTPFMEWMIHGGMQNNFDSILGARRADPAHFFYASHLSLKRQLIQGDLFSAAYKEYGWEDLDAGRRLGGLGARLAVLHEAKALHHHRYEIVDILRRQYAIGASLSLYQQQFPKADIMFVPSLRRCLFQAVYIRLGLRQCLVAAVSVLGQRRSYPRLFSLLATAEFWRGIMATRRT